MIRHICPPDNSFLSREASAALPKAALCALPAPCSYVRFPRPPGGPLLLFAPGPFPRTSIPNLSSCVATHYVLLSAIERAEKGPLFLPGCYFVAEAPRRASVHSLIRAKSSDSLYDTVTDSARSFSKKTLDYSSNWQYVLSIEKGAMINPRFGRRGAMRKRNFKRTGVGLSILLSATALLILQLSGGGETYGERFK
jgi:hypothetical protein